MTSGRVHSIIFVSRAAQAWWRDRGVGHKTSFEQGPIRRRGRIDEQYPLFNSAHQHVLHWGIPKWKFNHLSSTAHNKTVHHQYRRKLGFSDTDFVFLVLGLYHPLKGQAGILRSFLDVQSSCGLKRMNSSSHFRLVFVGGGLWIPDVFPRMFFDSQFIEELPEVRLLPSASDVSVYLAMSDVVVSNTQGEGETWGLSTLEAIASEKVVLAAAVGGTLEQLEHNKTALLHSTKCDGPCNLNDGFFLDSVKAPQNLASHMCSIGTDNILYKRLQQAGRNDLADRLGQNHIYSDLESIFGGV